MPEPLTLSQLQCLINEGIEGAHPLPYWVAAEVGEAKLHSASGHFYMELVEKGGDNHVPKAKVRACIYKSEYKKVNPYFLLVTGSGITAGMKIMAKANVTYHELYGLSLKVIDIEPSYTLGDMERQRQETIRRLEEDGIFDMNSDLELPAVIQKIAVISSADAAGYQDFMQEITAGSYNFRITLFEAFMQGEAAEESVISALESIAVSVDEYDVVVIIRGGGSQSDLGCFNSYRLCCNVAQFPLPVLTGIGHDKDSSVADMVARLSLKTPTAVAVFLKERMADFESELDSALSRLATYTRSAILSEREKIRGLGIDLNFRTSGRLRAEGEMLERISVRLDFAYKSFLRTQSVLFEELANNVSLSGRLFISNSLGHLRHKESLISAYDPRRILERGYSVVRHNGSVLKDYGEVAPGDDIEIENKDNFIEAKINSIR